MEDTATAALEGRYAALRAGAAELSSQELLEVIEQAQREKDAASARQAVALAHLSAREPHLLEDGTWAEVHHGLGHQRVDAPELAAARMGCSVHVASNRMLTAIRQLTRTPAVVDAMARGDLDEHRAAAVTEESEFLSDESAAEVVDRVKDHWAGLTMGPLRRFVARTAAQVDPGAVAKAAEDERERRGLTRRTGTHGTDHWRGDFTVEHARTAWAAVTERARQLVREGHAETLQQARADAMMELILEHCDVTVVVHTTRSAEQADGEEPAATDTEKSAATPDTDTSNAAAADASRAHPPITNATRGLAANTNAPASALSDAGAMAAQDLVEVGGLGAPGTTFVPRDWLDHAPHPDVTAGDPMRDLTCDAVTGALLAGDVPEALASGRTRPSRARRSEDPTEKYRIPEATARLVRLRDGSCRFPGCSTPARQCDLDHVRPWPQGPTASTNLMALCRRHHRIKQRPGWTVRIHPDATVTWTDPTNHHTTTRPVDHLHLLTAHATRSSHDADPTAPADPAPADDAHRPAAELPSTFEDELADLLDADPRTPQRSHVLTYDADGRILSGPPPRIDLENGQGPWHRPGPPCHVIIDFPPPPPPTPEVIPF